MPTKLRQSKVLSNGICCPKIMVLFALAVNPAHGKHNPSHLETLLTCFRPELPFRLISNTGASSISKIPPKHHCIKNARTMAMTHNTFFRALNSIYQRAPHIISGTQQAADFLSYCRITYDFIHHHQVIEETIYFPEIEKVAGIPGLMDTNIAQHLKMEAGLERFRKFGETTRKDKSSVVSPTLLSSITMMRFKRS